MVGCLFDEAPHVAVFLEAPWFFLGEVATGNNALEGPDEAAVVGGYVSTPVGNDAVEARYQFGAQAGRLDARESAPLDCAVLFGCAM